jgi:hypothetical protein
MIGHIVGLKAFLAVLLAVSFPGAAEQSASTQPAGSPMSAPTISFSFSLRGAAPSRYTISVNSAGRGQYESEGSDSSPAQVQSPFGASSPGDGTDSAAPEVYRVTFDLPEASSQRIFALAAEANYFNGNFDYRKKRLADTGVKTLTYADGARRFQTAYNYSGNQAVTQLTALFQGLSASLETGRHLEYLYSHNRLGLDEELKRDQEFANTGQLAEITVLVPILRRISQDTAVMHVARQHAQKLLDLASPVSSRK